MDLRKTFQAVTGIVSLFLIAGAAGAAEFITIGTGGVTGVYYPTGGAICRLVNKGQKEHCIRCSVVSTGGSVYNINTIRAGELDMGVAQSDWQYHAYNGTSRFKDAGPFKELRAVFSVHAEPVSIIARKDSGISNVQDLVGKRVNIGNPGSGTEATWNVMWQAMGHTNGDLKLAAQMKSAETPGALCDNKIDVFFWVAGHPSASIKEATTKCDAVIVIVTGPALSKCCRGSGKEIPYYSRALIPGGMYRGNPNGVETFGVRATVVSSTRTSNDTVYHVVKAVFDNFDAFRKLHPSFANLTPSEMIKLSISAPLHDGAAKYYKEKGWM